MKYEDALKMWGYYKLRKQYPKAKIDVGSVLVSFNYEEPSPSFCETCGPDSPVCEIFITDGNKATSIDMTYDFNFSTILKEIIAAGDGELT